MLLATSLILAQVAAPAAPAFSPSDELLASQQAWREALEDRPQLVTLSTQADPNDEPVKKLQNRLRLLEVKAFSNREWKGYWERQVSTARAYASDLSHASVPAGPARAKGLRDWADLASRKIANQDVYLQAVVTERDALENAIDALDQVEEAKFAADDQALAGSQQNPVQLHRRHLADLARRLKGQRGKLLLAQADRQMVARQVEATGILNQALVADTALAQEELRIADEQGLDVEPATPSEGTTAAPTWSAEYGDYWSKRAQEIRVKAEKIAADAKGQKRRLKGYQIEKTLVDGRIKYRQGRVSELESRITESSSFGRWSQVAVDGLVDWSQARGWQVLLGLLVIALLLKLFLGLINIMGRGLEKAADDGDDSHQSASEQRAGTIAAVMTGLLRIAAFVVAGLVALDTIGVNTGPILGSVAILGLAISFGSQSLVKDLVNGFFILIENQYAVGDVVEVAGQTGTVEQINLRSTRVRQLDGTLHVIPNGSISRVANQTRDWCRALCHVGVGYDSDLNQVEQVVNQVGEAMFGDTDWQEKLRDAPAFVGVTELADSAITVRVMATTGPGDQWAVVRELNKRLKESFEAESIEIPFPQRVIHSNVG